MTKRILYIFLPLVVFLACKKQKAEHYPIPDSLKQMALFHKNSYWIYINDTTLLTDSAFVYSEIVTGTNSYSASDDVNIEIDYMRMPINSVLFSDFYLSGKLGSRSSAPGYPFSVNIYGYGKDVCDKSTAFILHDDTLTNHKGNSYSICDYNPSRKVYILGGDKFFELGECSSLQVNSLNFENVRITRSIFSSITYKANFALDTVDYYFSPGDGIVKVVLRIDTANINSSEPKRATMSWSLLRFKTF